MPARVGPGRPRVLRAACRGPQKPRRNGQAGAPLPDLKERPMRAQNYESDWLPEQLRPAKLPWES